VSCLRPIDPFVDVGGVLSVSAQYNPQCRQTQQMLHRRAQGKAGKGGTNLEDLRKCQIEEGLRTFAKSCKSQGKPLPDGMPASFADDELPLLTMTITVKGFLSSSGATRYFITTRDAHSDLPPLPDDACTVPLDSSVQPRVAVFSGDSDSVECIDDDLRCMALLVTWKRWWIKLTANFSPSTCTAADSVKLMAAAAKASLLACSGFCAWPERQCGHCTTMLSDSTGGKCAKCECIIYCGAKCQKAHWAKHRMVCKRSPFVFDRAEAGLSWRERDRQVSHAMLDESLEAARTGMANLQASGKVIDEFADVGCPQQ